MKRWYVGMLSAVFVSACAVAPGASLPGPSAKEGMTWGPVQTAGLGERLARIDMFGPSGRRLLQLGPLVAYSPADIGSIQLILLRDTGGVPGPGGANYTEVARNIRNLDALTPYTNTVTIGNLKIGATYVVRSEAFVGPDATGEQIDTMVASDNTCLPFTAPGVQTVDGLNQIETTPQVVSLPLVLKNKVFSGQASDADGLSITNGDIENNSAPETISP